MRKKRTGNGRRLAAFLLTAAMMLALPSQSAFAAETGETGENQTDLVENIEFVTYGSHDPYYTPKFSADCFSYELGLPMECMSYHDGYERLPVVVTLQDGVEAAITAKYQNMETKSEQEVPVTAGERTNLDRFFTLWVPEESNDLEIAVKTGDGKSAVYQYQIKPALSAESVRLGYGTDRMSRYYFRRNEEKDNYEFTFSYPETKAGQKLTIEWQYMSPRALEDLGAGWTIDGEKLDMTTRLTETVLTDQAQDLTGYMDCDGKWRSPEYVIHLNPVPATGSLTFTVTTPEEDTGKRVRLYDGRTENGTSTDLWAEQKADADNPLQFSKLEDGVQYLYEVTSDHYRTEWGIVTASSENQEITVNLNEKEQPFDEEYGIKTLEFFGIDLERKPDLDAEYGGAEVYYGTTFGEPVGRQYTAFNTNGKLEFKEGNTKFDFTSTPKGDSLILSGYQAKSSTDPFTDVAFQMQIDPDKPLEAYVYMPVFGAGINIHGNTFTLDLMKDGEVVKTYKLLVDVIPVPRLIEVSSGELSNLLKYADFSPEKTEYEIDSGEYRVDSMTLEVGVFNPGNPNTVNRLNGLPYADRDRLTVSLNEDPTQPKDVKYEVSYTYTDKTGRTATMENTCTLKLKSTGTKTPPWLDYASAAFELTDPLDAAVTVYNGDGQEVRPDADNPLRFSKILKNREYYYTVSKYGYASVSRNFTLEGDQTITVPALTKIDTSYEEIPDIQWGSFRNSETNNGVTAYPAPNDPDTAYQKWAVKLGENYTNSITPPLILDGKLYSACGRYVKKVNRDTGAVEATSEKLEGMSGYAMNPLAYGEGKIFIHLGSGRIQCLDAQTLKSLWVSEPIIGQNISPITYHKGYIYSGTWNNERRSGTYYCINVADEDPSQPKETKRVTWRLTPEGRGFYWAGSYVNDVCAVFGSDDGSSETTSTNTSVLYSVQPTTGRIIDTIEGLYGDIRSTVTYDDGKLYFSSKGGMLYRVKLNADGTFDKDSLRSFDLGGMATAAPLVYNGRIYLGMCGASQFGADSGHAIAVVNDAEDGLSLAWKRAVPGYPQAGPVATTAYVNEDFDGDGAPDNRVYIYFTCNAFPGGLYYIYDEPGMTDETAPEKVMNLFSPEKAQQEYCISTVCLDNQGTMYYKNDSGYLMAVAKNTAYLSNLEVFVKGRKIDLEEDFSLRTLSYTAYVDADVTEAEVSLTLAEGRTAMVNGTLYTPGERQKLTFTDGMAEAEIVVSHDGASRTYHLMISSNTADADLAGISLNCSNQKGIDKMELTEAFDPAKTEYTGKAAVMWNDRPERNGDLETDQIVIKYVNLWPETSDPRAGVRVIPVEGVDLDNRNLNLDDDGSVMDEGGGRYPIYFEEDYSTAIVQIEVTASDRVSRKVYTFSLNRWDCYAPQLTDLNAAYDSETTAKAAFTSNEAGVFYCALTEKDAQEPVIDTSAAGTAMARGMNTFAVEGLDAAEKDLYLVAKDEKGHVGAMQKISLEKWTPPAPPVPLEPDKPAEPGQSDQSGQPEQPAQTQEQALTISAVKLTLYTAGKKTASLKAKADGADLPAKSVKWKTSNRKVATVNASGRITAKKKGKATVTATWNGKSVKCTVTVKKPSFKLKKSSVTLKKGKKYAIKYTAAPKTTVTYKSGNKKIATVNAKGIVKAKKKGTATITATCNGITRKLKVKVK